MKLFFLYGEFYNETQMLTELAMAGVSAVIANGAVVFSCMSLRC